MRFLSLACLVSLAAGFMPASTKVARTAAPSIVDAPTFLQDASAHCSSTELNALLEGVDITEKYYVKQEKEFPKVLGGLSIGLRKLVVVTGASSGLGLNCAATLAKNGGYFVVMACRDVEKGREG